MDKTIVSTNCTQSPSSGAYEFTMRKRPLIRGLVAMLIGILGISVAPILGNSGLTDGQCHNAWQSSPSVAWCSIQDYEVTDANKCKLELACGTGSDRPEVTYTGYLNQVKKLRWCHSGVPNNGWLVSGNC